MLKIKNIENDLQGENLSEENINTNENKEDLENPNTDESKDTQIPSDEEPSEELPEENPKDEIDQDFGFNGVDDNFLTDQKIPFDYHINIPALLEALQDILKRKRLTAILDFKFINLKDETIQRYNKQENKVNFEFIFELYIRVMKPHLIKEFQTLHINPNPSKDLLEAQMDFYQVFENNHRNKAISVKNIISGLHILNDNELLSFVKIIYNQFPFEYKVLEEELNLKD